MNEICCAADLRQAVRALDAQIVNVLIGGADADTLLDDVVELATHATGWLPVCKTLLANLRMEADNWADQEMQFGRPLRILGAA